VVRDHVGTRTAFYGRVDQAQGGGGWAVSTSLKA
jgi:hypothetical protein